ncbi:hypothetical protein [Streptomyces sp. NPDC051677]
MAARHGDRLEEWIAGIEHDTPAPLAAFARNLAHNFDAVPAT